MITQERRSTPRVRAYRPVRLHAPHNPRVVETLTKDLSIGGLRCLSPMVLPVSSEVNVELMPSTGEEPISLTGKTVWFRLLPHTEQCDVGISFKEISEQNKRRLSAYLDHIQKKS